MKRADLRRLLIIAPQGLGDALQITPLLPALSVLPGVAIDVITLRPTTTAFFSGLDGLVSCVSFLPFWTRGRVPFALALVRVVLTRRYEESFLAYPAARWEYQLMHALIRSKRRFAHRYDGNFILDGVPGFSVQRIAPGRQSNVRRNADLLRAGGYAAELTEGYRVPATWRARNATVRERVTVIHVGSIKHDSFAGKRWPLHNFIELARRLIARGERVLYLAGPDELIETREAYERTPGAAIFEGPLDESAALLDRAALVVTNDSGIGHLSAGLGRPVISLFGPTPLEYAPYGPTSVPLRPSVCPPCFDVLRSDMTCKLNIDYACLRRDLSVELVEGEAVRILAGATS